MVQSAINGLIINEPKEEKKMDGYWLDDNESYHNKTEKVLRRGSNPVGILFDTGYANEIYNVLCEDIRRRDSDNGAKYEYHTKEELESRIKGLEENVRLLNLTIQKQAIELKESNDDVFRFNERMNHIHNLSEKK